MNRFLITTPLEETWRKDVPVLFLGEWCLSYPRQPSDLGVDVEIMPYHWNDRSKLFKDYQYIRSYYEVVLKKLSQKLNDIHNVDHSVRYWRILVGPWLGLFMLFLFDRWNSIYQAVNGYNLSGSIVLTGLEESLTSNDMREFAYSFFSSDEWNHHIYARILDHFPSLTLDQIERSKPVNLKPVDLNMSVSPSHVKVKLKQYAKSLMARFGRLFSKECDVLFLSTYLTRMEEAFLSMQLGQFPQLQLSIPAVKISSDGAWRRWVLEGETRSGFEACLSTLIPEQIPRVYLEGYKQLNHQAEILTWPKKPRAIWTSNSCQLDDVFKVWAGDKVESGSTLIIGQHGGNYGIGLWNWQEEHEIAISDRYLTWGWSRPSIPKLQPVGKIKYSRPVKRITERGSALLVTAMAERYGNPSLAAPTSSQWLEYLEEQFDFVNELSVPIQNKLIVRLHRMDYGWRQMNRWRDRFPMLQINDGFSDISKLISNCRLYISTYNATTYLESLSMNIPTVIYWDPKYTEINAWAQPYFDELRSVGIFHETPQSAALHVTKIWSNIVAWWDNPETLAVRDRFVRQFAYCPEDKIGRLKNAINEVASQC